MKNIISKSILIFSAIFLIYGCDKHVVEYNSEPVNENMAEFQLHYFVPLATGVSNNIYKVEINNQLYANTSGPLTTYNAIPNGSVGKFFTTTIGQNNIKLYKGNDSTLVYDQNVNLQKGKQNIFVYDFNKPPIVFDNQYPYPKNITENSDTTAWVKFYNFLFEEDGVATNKMLQYQYQYTMDIENGVKSDWINVGEPVAFGQSTGWEPVNVIKSVAISSGYARIDYRINIIGSDGSNQGSLQIINSSGKFVNYSDWWTAYIGRAYHHVLSGMRTKSPRTAVRVFTAL